jgi:hypothetical protein
MSTQDEYGNIKRENGLCSCKDYSTRQYSTNFGRPSKITQSTYKMLVSGHRTHDLYKIMGGINLRTEFEILKVKVPIHFLGMVPGGFLAT